MNHLAQNKLTKQEWESMERPIEGEEMNILNLIQEAFSDPDKYINTNLSLLEYLKMKETTVMQEYLFHHYFYPPLMKIVGAGAGAGAGVGSWEGEIKNYQNSNIKQSDKLRLKLFQTKTEGKEFPGELFEFVLLELLKKWYTSPPKSGQWYVAHYTLFYILNSKSIHIKGANPILLDTLRKIIKALEIFPLEFAVEVLEKNTLLLKYVDKKLYSHQKEIFQVAKQPNAKLILYIAPTGTGKTLTPIGLSEKYRILFICAARHIGMEFARSAIAKDKKIAFAFGCESSADIRLHNNAAKSYERNYRTGGIFKIDNTEGEKVEIIISDVSSYLHAMNYLLSFHPDPQDILTYWDEPTIAMDVATHPLHEWIHRNWTENLIPNIVLSSATLPKQSELLPLVENFRERFECAQVYEITSHDCVKTIPLLNRMGLVIMPHTLASQPETMGGMARHCLENLSLLRYLDLASVVEVLQETQPELTFSYEEINMNLLKTFYLRTLLNANYVQQIRTSKLKRTYLHKPTQLSQPGLQKLPSVDQPFPMAGRPLTKLHSIAVPPNSRPFLYLTTEDAHTLTEGPTIFITNQLDKMAKFYIQESKSPETQMSMLYQIMEDNQQLQEEIRLAEEEMEDILSGQEKSTHEEAAGGGGGGRKGKKEQGKKQDRVRERAKEKQQTTGLSTIQSKLEYLTGQIKNMQLKEEFIPNKLAHLKKWCGESWQDKTSSFASSLTEADIHQVMLVPDVSEEWKVLLLMGIGVFTENQNKVYLELMKNFAVQQKLYLIIADSDYLFGLNYQFCQGYIGKDLDVTQEKIIQCLGRIGRNALQKAYTARFCEESHANLLFLPNQNKMEAQNMNLLFS